MAVSAIYDVIIVGSGASGGVVAKQLTEAGAQVALLEARDFRQDWPYHRQVWQYPHRGGLAPRDRPPAGFRSTGGSSYPFLFWHHPDEPYTFPEGQHYDWLRARVVAGRSMFWGRIVLRLNPMDFKTRSYDGCGADWPIRYEDLEPYYDKVETFIGVTGNKDGIIDSPDGKFQKPLPPSCAEAIFGKTVRRLGLPVIRIRKAILTEPLNGRAACHYCGRCDNGCETRSNSKKL